MARTVIERVRDQNKLLALFTLDRVRNAYQIGSMSPGYQDYTRHYWLTLDEEPKAAITVYDGLSAPALFAWGETEELALLLDRLSGQLPGRMLLHRYPEHLSAYGEKLKIRSVRKEVRLTLTVDQFKAQSHDVPIERLSHRDTAAIVKLYGNYPDSFFEPYQLESGYYFGLREGQELVSVAGIHLVSESAGVAMLGNVVTAPSTRGKGYARYVTSTLCEALFESVDLLALDVPMGSTAARHAFEALGFESRFHYEQVLVHKGTGWVDDD
jgi:ribosomal protein S18 acetylase RimI-like enzyme